MNKNYDKYLCRAAPKEFCKVYTDTFGRKYVYVGGNKCFIGELYNYGDLELYNLTPVKQFEQVDPNIILASKFVLKIGLALFVLIGICTYFSIK